MDTVSTLRDLSPLALFVVFVLALLKFMSDQSGRETQRNQADADRRTASYDKLASAMDTLKDATLEQTKNTRQNTRFTHRASKTIEKTAQEVQNLSAAVISLGTTIPEQIIHNQDGLAKNIVDGIAPIPERLIVLEKKIDLTTQELGLMKSLVEHATQSLNKSGEQLTTLLTTLDSTLMRIQESNEMLSRLSKNEGE
jgi:hypothetical protein